MIKNNEYEDIGENIFPLQYLTEDEIKELKIRENKCCKDKKGKEGCCTKGKQCLKKHNEKESNFCSRCNTCCKGK